MYFVCADLVLGTLLPSTTRQDAGTYSLQSHKSIVKPAARDASFRKPTFGTTPAHDNGKQSGTLHTIHPTAHSHQQGVATGRQNKLMEQPCTHWWQQTNWGTKRRVHRTMQSLTRNHSGQHTTRLHGPPPGCRLVLLTTWAPKQLLGACPPPVLA